MAPEISCFTKEGQANHPAFGVKDGNDYYFLYPKSQRIVLDLDMQQEDLKAMNKIARKLGITRNQLEERLLAGETISFTEK